MQHHHCAFASSRVVEEVVVEEVAVMMEAVAVMVEVAPEAQTFLVVMDYRLKWISRTSELLRQGGGGLVGGGGDQGLVVDPKRSGHD